MKTALSNAGDVTLYSNRDRGALLELVQGWGKEGYVTVSLPQPNSNPTAVFGWTREPTRTVVVNVHMVGTVLGCVPANRVVFWDKAKTVVALCVKGGVTKKQAQTFTASGCLKTLVTVTNPHVSKEVPLPRAHPTIPTTLLAMVHPEDQCWIDQYSMQGTRLLAWLKQGLMDAEPWSKQLAQERTVMNKRLLKALAGDMTALIDRREFL